MKQQVHRPAGRFYIPILIFYTLFVAEYAYARYAWNWLDSDAASLTMASQRLYDEGTVAPSTGAYPYGYAYAALNTFLAHILGIRIATLQAFIQPFLVAVLVPLAYATFRNFARDRDTAVLASLLLFLQPEFLFESVRSSHAKVTWAMALGMLLVLTRSLGSAGGLSSLFKWSLLFYLMAFGLIASNSFFASSYIFGIGFAFLGGRLLIRWREGKKAPVPWIERLLYITFSCSVLLFVFYFYLYPPALQQFTTLKSILDQIAVFFLNFEIQANPYEYVQVTWLNPWIYIALTTLNWILLVLSFVSWLLQARWLLLRRSALPSTALLLWLLYTSFALLLALSVILDVAGVLSANLQVRLFPHLMVVAIPLASELATRITHRIRHRRGMLHRLSHVFLASCIAVFSMASLLKVTNEPLLSNQWMFLSQGERSAVEWVGMHLRYSRVWTEIDGRLTALTRARWTDQGIVAERGSRTSTSRDFLMSPFTEVRALRLRVPLPDTRFHLRVYDNGNAVFYHARPKTPFQR